jgi:hypothetical protein
MACHSHGARKRMPVYAAGTLFMLQAAGGQGALSRPNWYSGFLFSWEVTKSHKIVTQFAPLEGHERHTTFTGPLQESAHASPKGRTAHTATRSASVRTEIKDVLTRADKHS